MFEAWLFNASMLALRASLAEFADQAGFEHPDESTESKSLHAN
jgi:hypothetical protein